MQTSSLKNNLTPRHIAQLHKFELKAKCIVDGFYSGRHGSNRFGQSENFAELRNYEQGDPLRLIDWRAFGRTNHLFVRKFHDESNMDVVIALDSSASMGFKSNAMSKSDYGACLAISLAMIMTHQSDRVGLALFDQAITDYITPGCSSSQVFKLMDSIEKSSSTGKTDICSVVETIQSKLQRRSLVILVSDLLTGRDDLQKALAIIRNARNDVLLLQVMDPAELKLNLEDDNYKLIDPETGNTLHIDRAELETHYHQTISSFLTETRHCCMSFGVDHYLANTDHPFDTAIHEIIQLRKGKRKGL